MTLKPIRNIAASVKQRLLNLAKQRNEDFNHLLGRFVIERFLFRLGQSEHRNDYILKGAMLFHLRSQAVPHRPTRDLDLLGSGSPDIARIISAAGEICRTPAPDDGVEFRPERIRGERIRDHAEYLGIRLRLEAWMGSARIPLQIDVGFGDAILPAPKQESLLSLLDLPPPLVLAYPWETMIAEKFQAIVALGMDNSRMKDFFDLRHLAQTQPFNGQVLAQSIKAAFARRATPLPDTPPVGLRPEFGDDPAKQIQWRAFTRKIQKEETLSLKETSAFLWDFLGPPTSAARSNVVFRRNWPPAGPWRGK